MVPTYKCTSQISWLLPSLLLHSIYDFFFFKQSRTNHWVEQASKCCILASGGKEIALHNPDHSI